MADRFDQVAKAVAAGQLSRRQALKRVGIGAGVGLLALVGGSRTAFASSSDMCLPKGAECSPSGERCCQGLKCNGVQGGHCQ